jgi:signal transduction histidine kinase/CheY-like chemotaxis protein
MVSRTIVRRSGRGLANVRKTSRNTFQRFIDKRLVSRLRMLGWLFLAALSFALFWAPFTWTDLAAHGIMLTMVLLVLILPFKLLSDVAIPIAATLCSAAVGYILFLYPVSIESRVGLSIFVILSTSAIAPTPGTARTLQGIFCVTLMIGLNVATGAEMFNLHLMGIFAASLTGWVLGWQNIATWRETWEDREILTHVSNQLARQSRTLKESIEQTRDELKSKHQLMVDQERLATLGRLAVGIGHEINNPLTVAMTNVDLARTEEPDPELLDDASIALKRIRDIVKDLSQIARSDEPQLLSIMSLDDILHAAINTARMGLKSSLHIIIDPVPPVAVRVNQRRLVQVLVNILINAWHAMEHRGGGTIQITTEAGFGVVKIHVDDDGPGIPVEQMETVFEPFYTSKPAGKGTGLGLPISRSYLRAMGGDLYARMGSALGGARLTLSLARAADGEAITQSAHTDPGTAAMAVARNKNPREQRTTERPILLIVDDEPAIRRSLSKSLRRRWEVTTAAGTTEALDILREQDVDVLLCDLVLCDEDALDVLETLAQYRPDLLEHAVLMSGEPTSGRLMDLARINRRYLNRKPFSPTDLQDLLHSALLGHPTPLKIGFQYQQIEAKTPTHNPTTW